MSLAKAGRCPVVLPTRRSVHLWPFARNVLVTLAGQAQLAANPFRFLTASAFAPFNVVVSMHAGFETSIAN
jgi:hypothetical protein